MVKSSKSARHEIKRFTEVLVNQFDPEKIILFGSHAWGEPDEDSDVDLLIVKKTNNRWQTHREMDGALYPRTTSLDLLVYTPKQLEKKYKGEDFFIRKIIKQGSILYEKP